ARGRTPAPRPGPDPVRRELRLAHDAGVALPALVRHRPGRARPRGRLAQPARLDLLRRRPVLPAGPGQPRGGRGRGGPEGRRRAVRVPRARDPPGRPGAARGHRDEPGPGALVRAEPGVLISPVPTPG